MNAGKKSAVRHYHQRLADIGFPKFNDYFQAEKKTVEFLANSGELASAGNEFSDKMQVLYSKICAWDKCTQEKMRPFCLDFYGTIESNVESRKSAMTSAKKFHRVGLGACVRLNKKQQLLFSTFVIEIFGESKSKCADKLLTRIHFDIASPEGEEDSRFPIYHVQFGGNPEAGREYSQNHSDIKSLSYPRVMSYPLSLALFFDLAFRELGCDAVRGLVKDHGWRNIVHDHERMMLYPCLDEVLRQCRNDKTNLSDVYYGS